MLNRQPFLRKSLWLDNIKQFVGFGETLLTLENKLFNIICLLLGVTMLTGIISNILLGFPIYLTLVEFVISGICIFAFYRSKIYGYHENMSLGCIVAGIILFIPAWFLNGGIEGSTIIIGVFFIVLITILLRRRYHLFFTALLIAVFLACYYLGAGLPAMGNACKKQRSKRERYNYNNHYQYFDSWLAG